MPITPAYVWHEAETSVSIDIKIRAVTQSSADILMTDCYTKVNRAPYFFEADLYGEIDARKSSASVGQDVVKFFLIKKVRGLWGKLTLPGDRKMVLDRRNQSLAAVREQAHKDREDMPAKLSNIGRLAVGEQMKLEEAKRKAIEAKKNEELWAEQESLKSWMASKPKQADTRRISDTTCSEAVEYLEMERGCIAENSITVRESHHLQRGTNTNDITANITKISYFHEESTSLKWLPAPRRSSSIPVTFSVKPERPSHLPARESRDNVQLKKKEIVNTEASNPTEREPIFLQDRADKFFKSGDFESAINAYTSALESDPTLLLSLVNRAACNLQMGQYEDCNIDVFKALQTLQEVEPSPKLASFAGNSSPLSDGAPRTSPDKPADEISFSNLELLKCLKAREVNEEQGTWEASIKKQVLLLRGTSRYHQGKLQQALEDYVQTLQFEPTQRDIQRIVTHIQGLLKDYTS